MKRIQILGTGCPKCKTLTTNAEAAVKALGIEATVEKVEKIAAIMKFGVPILAAHLMPGPMNVDHLNSPLFELLPLLKRRRRPRKINGRHCFRHWISDQTTEQYQNQQILHPQKNNPAHDNISLYDIYYRFYTQQANLLLRFSHFLLKISI